MATYQEIQDRVAVRVISIPSAVQGQVPRLINKAIRKLAERHDWQVMRAELQANTTLLTRALVAKPANWKKPRQDRPWIESKEGFVSFLGWLPTEEEAFKLYSAASDLTDKGAPLWLRMADATDAQGTQQIEVYPLPDSNSGWVVAPVGQYRVRVPYWAYPTDLVNGTDTNWFTVNADLFIEYWATAEAFSLDEDELRWKKFLALAEKEYNDIVSVEKRAKIGAMRHLRIRTGVFGPRTQGRL